MDPDSHVYNITSAFHLQGDLNLNALQSALDGVLRRHEVLRTRIRNEDGKPVLALVADEKWRSRVSLEERDSSRRGRACGAAAASRSPATVESSRGQLCALPFCACPGNTFAARRPHIAPALAMRILPGIAESYEASSRAAPQGASASDSVCGVRTAAKRRFQGKLWRGSYYWKRTRRPAPVLDLRTDHPRSERQRHRGVRELFLLDGPLTAELKALSLRRGGTLFMTLLAALQILLSRYTEQTDIQIGTPAANRDQEEIENLIGFFVNTLVLRTDLSGDPTFEEVLRRVREVALGAYAPRSSIESCDGIASPSATAPSPLFGSRSPSSSGGVLLPD